jgi:membrane protein DedA with SNARE-associated domain
LTNIVQFSTAVWALIGALSLHDPWVAALAIIAGTLIHEDIATVATGILVADGTLSLAVALPALLAGVAAGDLGLYGLGRLIALGRVSQGITHAKRFSALKVWLDARLVAAVFVVRFLPGLRMAAYTSYGFLAMPFGRFAISVLLAVGIWTTGLFYLAYAYGALTANWLGMLRWPLIVIAGIVPLLAVERALRARIPGNDAQDLPP